MVGEGAGTGAAAGKKAPRVMKLRRDGTCATCGVALPVGTSAQWDPGSKTTTCLGCVAEPGEPIGMPSQAPAGPVEVAAEEPAVIESGVAGASAQREHDRRKAKREDRVRTRHPRIGGLILALSDEPQSTTAWAKGAVGERKVGEALDALRSDSVIVLHDRKVPGSRANIDHVVISSSGIHVIDAKRYTGRVEFRSTGSIFRPGPNKLFVGNRDKTKLVEAMAGQVDVVRKALEVFASKVDLDAIIRPSLCFIDADWGWFAKPMTLQGVRIGGPKTMISDVGEPGTLSPDQVYELGSKLAEALRPA